MITAMSTDTEQGISVELNIAFDWQEIDNDSICQFNSAKNINTFLLLDSLQEHSKSQTDESAKSSQEIERIESKLNLLLQLVNQLIERSQLLQQPRKVKLSVHGLCWDDATTPEQGKLVRMSIYLDPDFAQPVRFCARIDQGKGGKIKATFVNLDEREEELLSKWIFRIHRRSIALARRQ